MIAILMALALGVSQTTDDPIDAAFAHLDERYFTMLTSSVDALSAAVREGLSDVSSTTTSCLDLLTPLHGALNTKTLRRETRLFSTIAPEARSEAFEVTRATARDQASDVRRRLEILELREGTCPSLAVYRIEKQRTMDVLNDTQELLSVIAGQPPTSAPQVE